MSQAFTLSAENNEKLEIVSFPIHSLSQFKLICKHLPPHIKKTSNIPIYRADNCLANRSIHSELSKTVTYVIMQNNVIARNKYVLYNLNGNLDGIINLVINNNMDCTKPMQSTTATTSKALVQCFQAKMQLPDNHNYEVYCLVGSKAVNYKQDEQVGGGNNGGAEAGMMRLLVAVMFSISSPQFSCSLFYPFIPPIRFAAQFELGVLGKLSLRQVFQPPEGPLLNLLSIHTPHCPQIKKKNLTLHGANYVHSPIINVIVVILASAACATK